ncbi:amidohydrolase family protein [Kribbella sp. VKM Ac-2571]|uniref:amidohydrolase family protein n=1 Tax=Kribbella sp. VKM Ac-2571 TaxID=2512222 RepID=UPI00105F6081|nr:amidohydrolase family protein [Kribbella sp. VKM Ac-2571]TDO69278.1 amidohydrolase family protein [Kribbella sp. VKM Ac-2571]
MTVVDIHCHTFNGDDLPVKGFVKAVAGQRSQLARALAWALDDITQAMASGAEEIAELDRLIDSGPGEHEGAEESAVSQAAADGEVLLARLELEQPGLAAAAGAEAADGRGPGSGDESFHDGLDDLRRYLSWAALFGKTRLALTRALIETYPEVDLFTPMLVDLQGLDDSPKTSTLQQLELQEKISRLGILGQLGAQVLPFVGFDPRRFGAVALVKEAVTEFGCVGVKMYPPMGFLPWRNRQSGVPGMSAEQALGVDAALANLYDWCTEHDVPITAHGNPTQFAKPACMDFSGPERWAAVLQEWGDLRLNLGHFGWSGRPEWPRRIAELTSVHPRLYADIGNHDLDDLEDTIEALDQIFTAQQGMRQRFMFGSDWYMVASHLDFEHFLTRVRAAYLAKFPDQLDSFMGSAALTFLGFDDPANANNQRVRERYAAYGVTPPAWLAAKQPVSP